MKPIHFGLKLASSLVGILILMAGCGMSKPSQAGEPVSIIFDTDIGNDVDDALAMGVLHALESRRECKLIGVTITKDHPLAARFVQAVNQFYGRPDIPIGVCRSGKTPEPGTFLPLAETQDDQQLRYPHQVDRKDPTAVELLRRLLASQPDDSVVIVQVGFSTNLAALLDSKPDQYSNLDGMQLAGSKVRLLSLMAGAFTKIPGPKGQLSDHREYNVVEDLESCRQLAAKWPGQMLWSGFEIGLACPYPHQSILRDYGYVDHHPLAEAYHLYSPPPHDRPTWDLTSVLAAVRPEHGYFGLSEPGLVEVDPQGLTRLVPQPDGRHRYLKLAEANRSRVIEALSQLSSQPPQEIVK
jgi:inosine-uridine nucleoside N-ribohydrolase